jgi:predicted cupin superfamily sugar epimerase
MNTAQKIIETLDLKPHPEGGYFKETFRHAGADGTRGAGTAIYFLLERGQKSHWHQIDAAEIWHFYAGDPLLLKTSPEPGYIVERTLGPDLSKGQLPQLIVQPGQWQAAESTGDFTLVGCTVSPAFEFAHFVLAEPGFVP